MPSPSRGRLGHWRRGSQHAGQRPFLIDALVGDGDLWTGRVRVDGHVLFLAAESSTQEEAIERARISLAAHLQMLFTGATDTDHQQQQTERYGTLVELDAAQTLRKAAGWTLVMARFQDGHVVAVFQRDWPSTSGLSGPSGD